MCYARCRIAGARTIFGINLEFWDARDVLTVTDVEFVTPEVHSVTKFDTPRPAAEVFVAPLAEFVDTTLRAALHEHTALPPLPNDPFVLGALTLGVPRAVGVRRKDGRVRVLLRFRDFEGPVAPVLIPARPPASQAPMQARDLAALLGPSSDNLAQLRDVLENTDASGQGSQFQYDCAVLYHLRDRVMRLMTAPPASGSGPCDFRTVSHR